MCGFEFTHSSYSTNCSEILNYWSTFPLGTLGRGGRSTGALGASAPPPKPLCPLSVPPPPPPPPQISSLVFIMHACGIAKVARPWTVLTVLKSTIYSQCCLMLLLSVWNNMLPCFTREGAPSPLLWPCSHVVCSQFTLCSPKWNHLPPPLLGILYSRSLSTSPPPSSVTVQNTSAYPPPPPGMSRSYITVHYYIDLHASLGSTGPLQTSLWENWQGSEQARSHLEDTLLTQELHGA